MCVIGSKYSSKDSEKSQFIQNVIVSQYVSLSLSLSHTHTHTRTHITPFGWLSDNPARICTKPFLSAANEEVSPPTESRGDVGGEMPVIGGASVLPALPVAVADVVDVVEDALVGAEPDDAAATAKSSLRVSTSYQACRTAANVYCV